MNLFDIFGNNDDDRRREAVQQKEKPSELKKIAMAGIPLLLLYMRNKNKDEKKAEELRDTLSRHDVDRGGSIYDRINNADREDGDKIMDHVLGNDKEDVIDAIARNAGVTREEARKVMAQISPSVLEQLAEDTKNDRSVDAVRRTTDRQLEEYQRRENTLDLNDVIGQVLGGDLSKGLGNILGGLFK